MNRHRSGVSLALAATVIAAGAATVLLRPRTGLIDPQAVEASAYFTADQIDRARDFRGPQRILTLAELGLSGAALVLVALRPPRPLRSRSSAASPAAGGCLDPRASGRSRHSSSTSRRSPSTRSSTTSTRCRP